MLTSRCLLPLLCILPLASRVSAQLEVAPIFGDHMVLQRDQEVPFWGSGAPGKSIRLQFDQTSIQVIVGEDGKWRVSLPPHAAGGPFRITLDADNQALMLEDVMVGEVWLCSGQSNMEWPLQQSKDGEAEAKAAVDPDIRLFQVAHAVAADAQEKVRGSWQRAGPGSAPGFSAVAWFFGRELRHTLGVPIGLVQSTWGGTPAESWTSAAGLTREPELAGMSARYADSVRAAEAAYDKQVAEWRQKANASKAAGLPVDAAEPKKQLPAPPYRPSSLWNGMIAPLVPFAIRGVIWYQGESNADRAFQYRTLFPALIRSWRAAWQREIPFLFVQLASFTSGGDPLAWAELREAQSLALALPHTGMAVTIDIGDPKDIHPRNKQEVGHRLALQALAKVYGREVVCAGPRYLAMTVKGNAIELRFEDRASGLKTSDGGELRGFEIAGANHELMPARAHFEGDNIVVQSDAVEHPLAVRYAWRDNPSCNLINSAGLPAAPFRTDDWPPAERR